MAVIFEHDAFVIKRHVVYLYLLIVSPSVLPRKLADQLSLSEMVGLLAEVLFLVTFLEAVRVLPPRESCVSPVLGARPQIEIPMLVSFKLFRTDLSVRVSLMADSGREVDGRHPDHLVLRWHHLVAHEPLSLKFHFQPLLRPPLF